MPPSEQSERPLWQWVLLALLPGLISAGAAGISNLCYMLGKRTGDDIAGPMVVIQLLMPFIGLFYLIFLGGRYVKSAPSRTILGFVLGYGALNTLIWWAGCSLQWRHISIH